MKSVKLPDEMVNEIKDHIITNKAFGYETITEFVRGAVRHKLLECLPPRKVRLAAIQEGMKPLP